jgi:STAM-binding protein
MARALLSDFLRLAKPTTLQNKETCGILAGVLRSNALHVTTLLVPRQTATSDTCSTEDEEGLFAELEGRNLMAVGWIHTHPTQTCFMSSVDLHTHCSYQ